MNTTNTASFARTSDTEFTMIRSFDAPRDLVWKAWTTPEHVSQWFGLRGSSMSACDIDLRTGGSWRYVIQEADGTEMVMYGEFREIDPPGRLVYTEIFEMWPQVEPLVTMTLEEADGRTTLTSTTRYPNKEVLDMLMQSPMEEGAAITFDRLAEHLATMS